MTDIGVASGAGVFPTSVGTIPITLNGFGEAELGYHADYMFVILESDAERNAICFKCEIGLSSTLHLDPPTDYGADLQKCKRFFEVIYGVNGQGTTTSRIIPPPWTVEKRLIPTVTVYAMEGSADKVSLYNTSATTYNVSGIVVESKSAIRYIVSSGLTSGDFYRFTMHISADL